MTKKTGLEITEKQFATQVEDMLTRFGWHWCHWRPARTEHGWRTALSGHPGFPDYVAVRENRLIFAELKSEKGKVSPEQQEWLDKLEATGTEVYLWRPDDFQGIVEILR